MTPDEAKNRLLSSAVADGRREDAEAAIVAGADMNAKNSFGLTALEVAAVHGRTDIACLLIVRGAHRQPEAADSALRYAASGGHDDVARLLIMNGADVNAKDVLGQSPLHHAAWRGHTSVARLLIENGADINATRTNGVTPMEAARKARHVDVVKLLQVASRPRPSHVDRIKKRRSVPGERHIGD
jgi:ankyrin repeat protein